MRISDEIYTEMVLLLKQIEMKFHRDALRKEIDSEDNGQEMNLLYQIREILKQVDEFNN